MANDDGEHSRKGAKSQQAVPDSTGGDPERAVPNEGAVQLKLRRETNDRLRRQRWRRTPEDQGVFDPSGEPNAFHDVLIIGPTAPPDEFTRLPVVKMPGSFDARGNPTPQGSYPDPPEKWDAYDYAFRRTLSIARPQDWCTQDSGKQRGTAFGTLPVKREPASTACVACYLVDAHNFTHRNAWTAEEWNDIGSDDLEPAPSVDDETFEVMIAAPRGKVFYLKVRLAGEEGKDLWPPTRKVPFPENRGFIECIDLRHESELWSQLRNGLVAGRVLSYRKAVEDKQRLNESEPLPVVNITSLIPDQSAERLAAARQKDGGE